jgi:hypothetical protein
MLLTSPSDYRGLKKKIHAIRLHQEEQPLVESPTSSSIGQTPESAFNASRVGDTVDAGPSSHVERSADTLPVQGIRSTGTSSHQSVPATPASSDLQRGVSANSEGNASKFGQDSMTRIKRWQTRPSLRRGRSVWTINGAS